MSHGDVVSVDLGPPRGHAQAGHRPGVIVQDEETSQDLPTVVVVPVTSSLRAVDRFSHTIRIDPDGHNGLSLSSVLLVFQITAVDLRQTSRRIGRLSEAHLQQLDTTLRNLLRLPNVPARPR
ncbi:MAG: type II toxin-antitoxin system PemK/MazF family toxin [Gemmatimonadetes bacterium]|nr:type II toxin-antitoxin system PemK/MazF family toxin [Gemmatimonadota bacterium]